MVSLFNPMVGDSLSSLVNVKMTKNTIFRLKIGLKLNKKWNILKITEKILLFCESKAYSCILLIIEKWIDASFWSSIKSKSKYKLTLKGLDTILASSSSLFWSTDVLLKSVRTIFFLNLNLFLIQGAKFNSMVKTFT